MNLNIVNETDTRYDCNNIMINGLKRWRPFNLGWTELEWNGMEWNGLDWTRSVASRLAGWSVQCVLLAAEHSTDCRNQAARKPASC